MKSDEEVKNSRGIYFELQTMKRHIYRKRMPTYLLHWINVDSQNLCMPIYTMYSTPNKRRSSVETENSSFIARIHDIDICLCFLVFLHTIRVICSKNIIRIVWGLIIRRYTHHRKRGRKVCSLCCPLPFMHWISSSSCSSLERSHTRWALPFVTLLIEFVGACVHRPKKQATSHLKIQLKNKSFQEKL